jgi:hypothetical protein
MKSRQYKYMVIMSVLALSSGIFGCRKPYVPKPVKNAPRIMIVEGAINASSDPAALTVFRLTRTVPADSTNISPVLHAVLTVEGDNNSNYQLTEASIGYYYYEGLTLDTTRKYRLHIKTIDAPDEYLSDYVSVKITPPIDSVGFTVKNNGLQIYVNTHDPQNSTKYYRWDYEETWQFHSEFYSYYYSDGASLLSRPQDQQIYYCFADSLSSDIVLGSSAKLSSDVIFQNPVKFIPSTAERLETKYSILVHQYALTPDAYNFWANLRQNTEELGGIFDVQPSNINGNIYSISKKSEPVIGFVTACTVQSKRIFITRDQVPLSWQPISPYNCVQDTFRLADKSGQDQTRALIPLPPSELATSALLKDGIVYGYLGADTRCVDCTLRGFTFTPDFWK